MVVWPRVNAVYEKGMLRPLQPLDLAENERVVVTITQSTSSSSLAEPETDYILRLRRQLVHAEPAPGLEEVRRRLAQIPGSMTADFIAERENR
jgi:predicted DNA-binding antitoxin AbrB/MazE fold protein